MSYQPPKPTELPSGPTGDNAKATTEYGLSHTMYRITDPRKSIPFYTEILGMTLMHRSDSEGGKFTNYFVGYPQGEMPSEEKEPEKYFAWLWSQTGMIELCHNWGNETDGTRYCNGNEEGSRGFGHCCLFVDDLQKAVDRMTKLGVKFTKRPEEGSMRHIAFIADPDNYRIEILTKGRV